MAIGNLHEMTMIRRLLCVYFLVKFDQKANYCDQ